MNIRTFGEALARAIRDQGGPALTVADEALVSHDHQEIIRLAPFFHEHAAGRPVAAIAAFLLQVRREQQGRPIAAFGEARDRLRLHVVPADLDDRLVTRPLGPGLAVALVLDYPEYLRFIVQADLAALGEPEPVLWAVAEVNTDHALPEPERHPLPDGAVLCVFPGAGGADHAYRYAATHGPAVCGLPHRDFGFVIEHPTPEAHRLAAMAAVEAYGLAKDYPLSPSVYRFEQGRLVDPTADQPDASAGAGDFPAS